MAVRAFSGTSWIKFPGMNMNGAFTMAALVKMMDTTVPSGWQAVASSTDSSTHSQLTHYVRGTAGSTAPLQGVQTCDITATATGVNGVTKAITNPATWKILVLTKVAGSTVARMHTFPIGGAWTQEAGDAGSGNAGAHASGFLYLGAYADPSTAALGDFCNMRMALYGIWNGTALSDVQVQALATGLATSAWTGHAVTPTSVWELTQASTGTAVADLVGSNNQSAITGTTVVTGDDPSGWTFASGGGSSASGSFATHGGGDSTAVGVKAALRAVATTGAGDSTGVGAKNANGSIATHGGGDSTAVGTALQASSGSVATHGGGDSTATGVKAVSRTSATTAGGDSTGVGRKDGIASHDEASAIPPFTTQVTGTATTGGGDSTAVGTASSVDNRNGSVATHGGGDSTATGVKGALRATATTVGGGSTASGAKSVSRAVTTTGGGDSGATGTAGQASTGSFVTHGGGDSTAAGIKGATRVTATTVGGDSTAAGVKAVQRSVATTGGGDSTAFGTSVAGPSGRVQCTGGGSTTFAGKRATTASIGCTGGGALYPTARKAVSRTVACTGAGQARVTGINGVIVAITYPTGHAGRVLTGMTGRASHYT